MDYWSAGCHFYSPADNPESPPSEYTWFAESNRLSEGPSQMIRSINEKPLPWGELRRPLTDGDRIALASTALAILQLPQPLQQFINACDMLDILAGEPCGRAGYILGQAHGVLNAYSGFLPDGHKHVDWKTDEKTCAEVDKLVAKALEKRRELIAKREAFRASDERKALIARLKLKGFNVS
jgi:hypothetical protein